MQKDEPTIRLHEKVVSLLNGTSETFSFDCHKGDASYEVLTGAEFIEDIAITNGTISLKGKAVGEATIRIYIAETTAEDVLTVKVLDSSNFKHLYFTNNFDWPDVYLYAWGSNDSKNAEWPGEKLSEIGLNSFGQHVFDFYLNTVRYNGFVISSSNGQQSSDVSVSDERLNSFDNIYLETTQDELGHYNVGFANFEPASTEPSVKFARSEITLYEGHNETVKVVALNGSGVSYEFVSGSDKVKIVSQSDTEIELAWKAAGEALIKAKLGESFDELSVTCSFDPIPESIKKIYFTNNMNWEHVYLYAWGDNGANNGAWPGEELTHSQLNSFGQVVFDFEIDTEVFHSFIINNSGFQTRDISLSEEGLATNNNIYLVGDENPYDIGFASFEPATPPEPTVSFEFDSVTLYSDKDKTVKVMPENGSGVSYEITSGSTFVEIVAQSDSDITLHYLAEGEAVIKATLGDSSDELVVNCVAQEAPVTLKTLYFTNNYAWEHVYLYAWTNDGPQNAQWPGIELTHFELNNFNQAVFDFEIDSAIYANFIVNNGNGGGSQTRNIALSEESFATNNNIYIVGDSSPFDIGFANFEPATPPEPVVSVNFAVDSITVHEGQDEIVTVSVENGTGVIYQITDGETFVEIVSQSDTSITLHYLAEGSATITATLGEATDTLQVTCTASAAPSVVAVTFAVTYDTHANGDLYVAGIGGWDVFTPMTWTDGNVWTVTFDLEVGVEVNFKFVVRWKDSSPDTWENGSDRSYTPSVAETVNLSWQA